MKDFFKEVMETGFTELGYGCFLQTIRSIKSGCDDEFDGYDDDDILMTDDYDNSSMELGLMFTKEDVFEVLRDTNVVWTKEDFEEDLKTYCEEDHISFNTIQDESIEVLREISLKRNDVFRALIHHPFLETVKDVYEVYF